MHRATCMCDACVAETIVDLFLEPLPFQTEIDRILDRSSQYPTKKLSVAEIDAHLACVAGPR